MRRTARWLLCLALLAATAGCTSTEKREAEAPRQQPGAAAPGEGAPAADGAGQGAAGGAQPVPPAGAGALLAQAETGGGRPPGAGGEQPAGPPGGASVREQERYHLAEHHYRIGRRLYEEMRYREAAAQLRLALQANPDHLEAQRLLDRTLFILGERAPGFRDQVRQFAEEQQLKIKMASMEIERLYAEGLRHMERKEYSKAIDRFERVLETIRWFPYHIDKTGLERQARDKLAEAKKLEAEREQLLREQMLKAAREEATIWEKRNQAYHEARVRSLYEQAVVAFERLEFGKAEQLARRLLQLEPRHEPAAKLLEAAVNGRRHQAEVERIELRMEEMEKLIEGVYEAAVPYQEIFRFPPDADWQRVQKRAVELERRFERQVVEESAVAQRIRRTLETRLITIDFLGVTFQDAMQYLQHVTGLNFVVAKAAREQIEAEQPTINLKLTDVSLKSALRLILAQASKGGSELIWKIKNDTVWINTKDAEKEELILRFYEVSEIVNDLPDNPAPPVALQPPSEGGAGAAPSGLTLGGAEEEAPAGTGIEAEKLRELIEQRLGTEGQGSVEFLGGLLMVRKSLEDHKKVERLLEQLRRTTGIMVTVETRFIDIQDSLLEEIGVDFRGLPAVIQNFLGTGTNQPIGFNWTSGGFNTDVRAALVNVFSQGLGTAAGTPFNLTSIGGGLFQFNMLDTFQLQAIIDAVKRKQRAREVDAPRLTVFNGQRSHALSISQRAYIADLDPNQSGVTPTIAPVIGVLNVGSMLEARPVVSHDRKYVILEIQPTLARALASRFHRLQLVNLNTDITIELPSVALSQIKTTVMVPDGGTVILGGMKNYLEQKMWAGVPGIRNIPILNNLFQRQGYTDFKRSLIVLLTVHITIAREEEHRRFGEAPPPVPEEPLLR